MGKNVTDIITILDLSGSMQSTKAATIKGYNDFILEQRQVTGKARATLIQFSSGMFGDHVREIYSKVPIEVVPPLDNMNYQPTGGTPLYEAVIKTVRRYNRLKGKVVVLIITDGQENASAIGFNSLATVRELITQKRSDDWQFVFIGSDISTQDVALSFNIPRSSTMTFTADAAGTQSLYASASASTSDWRTGQTANVDVPEVATETPKP